MKQGKVWGQTEKIFEGNGIVINLLTIDGAGFSSLHCHKHKYNCFHVIDGALQIGVEKSDDEDLFEKTIIKDGENTVVAPGEYHEFHALRRTIALEIYFTVNSEYDIICKKKGGKYVWKQVGCHTQK